MVIFLKGLIKSAIKIIIAGLSCLIIFMPYLMMNYFIVL